MTQFGPYELLRRLGSGGNAEVFLATGPNPAGAERIALKLILPHLAEDPKHRDSLLREAELTKRLKHRNIVQIYDVGEIDARPFLSMEYVRGSSLAQMLRALKEKQQQLTLPEACCVVRETALGLHFAHEATDPQGRPLGLVHRDISPQNLMLRDDGQVKVVDFGIAKATLSGPTQTGGMKGKLAYMSPEQIEGHPIDRRADVFAVGAVLWELLSGQRLYTGQSEAEILQQALVHPPPDVYRVLAGLPRELQDALRKALERQIRRRYSTALEFADALKPWVSFDSEDKLAERLQRLSGAAPKKAAPRPDSARPRGPAPPKTEPEIPESPSTAARAVRRKPVKAPARKAAEKPRPTIEDPISVLLAPPPQSRRRRILVSLGAVSTVAAILGTAFVLSSRSSSKALVDPNAGAHDDVVSEHKPDSPDPDVDPAEPKRPKSGMGTLVLRTDVPALVRDGRRELGMTPLSLPLSPGTHRLSLRSADGKNMQQVTIQIHVGKETVREVALLPPEGPATP